MCGGDWFDWWCWDVGLFLKEDEGEDEVDDEDGGEIDDDVCGGVFVYVFGVVCGGGILVVGNYCDDGVEGDGFCGYDVDVVRF